MAEKIKLFEADIDVEGIVKKSGELRQAINNAKDAMVVAKFQTGETSKEYIKAEANVKKLSSEYRINQQQIINLTSASGDLLTVEQKLTTALDKEVRSIENAVDNNKELRKIRNSVNAETVEGQKAIADINKKIDENTAFIKANTDSFSQQKMEIGDYKTAIKEAYDELNIFNGGIMGFVQRAQQAGGVMPLLKNGLTGITQGIWGATKASIAFIATPIGIVIAALGAVIGGLITYLKSTQEGMDKVTAVTRPLQAIFQSLIGVVQDLGEMMFKAFTNPKKALSDLVDYIKNNVINRFKAFGVILEAIENRDFKALRNGIAQAATGIENLEDKIVNGARATAEFLAEAYKKGQKIDELQKQLEQREIDIIAWRAEAEKQLKEQEVISKNQMLSAEERIKAENERVRLAKEIVSRENEILDIQIEQLKIKQSLNDTSRDEEKVLQELIAQKIKNSERETDIEKQGLRTRNQITKEAANVAKQAAAERTAAGEKAFDAAIKKQQLELQLYLEGQGIKKRTMAEELKLAEEASVRLIAIERQRLERGKITAEEFKLFVMQSDMELARQRAEIAVDNANRELEAHIEANQTKLESSKVLSDLLVNEELNRLSSIAQQREQFEKERFDNGLINETEYQDNILAIQKDALDKAKELNDQYEIQKKADAQLQKEMYFQEELERMEAEGVSKYEIEKERLLFQYEEDTARLQEQREQGLITEAEYYSRRKALDDGLAESQKANSDGVAKNKLALAEMTYSNLAAILGKESAAGKAMAVAQATIDTYKAAVAAFAAGSSLGGPAGVIMGPVSAAIAVAAGLANVKKIVSTKAPKAERGAVFNIGGKRHSQGGTKFYGEDGTHFEAERDEKMFILNRQASAALGPLLSDINKQYGGVSLSQSSSYLAAGGQVYRAASQQVDSAANLEMMREAIREGSIEGTLAGSRQGSMEGSSRGTYSGMVDKETNEVIAAGANF